MAENRQSIFRQKTLDRISSPEQLTDYLRVTTPGIWVVLVSVILLLAGLFAWAAVGSLETKTGASVIVRDHSARVVLSESAKLESGMPLQVSSEESVIASVETDEYGRLTGLAELDLPDGTYEGTVVTDRIRPIDFLLESR